MPRAVLILLSLGVCAVRVHAQSVDMPGAVREVNSCLRLVRLAASRRGRSSATLNRDAERWPVDQQAKSVIRFSQRLRMTA